jgi:carboxypeptidase D
MHLGKPCTKDCGSALMNEHFPDGITNGAKWYALYGGMQDWNYLHSNCFEITLELGCHKYPYERDIHKFWNENKKSLIAFLEEVHKGVKGFVFDMNGKPIKNATIHVEGIDHDVYSVTDGDYWRLLIPGTYKITAHKRGYRSQTKTLQITSGFATQINFTLETGSVEWSKKYDFDNYLNLADDKYMSNNELHQNLEKFANENSNIVKIYSNTAPDKQRVLHFIVISADDKMIDNNLRPKIALIGGIRGDQPIGREILIRFTRHLIDGYKQKDPRILNLLQSLEIHIIPSIDDNGFQNSVVGQCNRSLSHENDMEDKFSDDYNNKFGPIEALKRNFISYKYMTGISFESNGFDMRFPSTMSSVDMESTTLSETALRALSKSYINNNPSLLNASHCDTSEYNSNQVKSKKLDKSLSLLDYAFSTHGTLMLAARISCCSYPSAYELPDIWRNNLESIMSFLEASLTGISLHF